MYVVESFFPAVATFLSPFPEGSAAGEGETKALFQLCLPGGA